MAMETTNLDLKPVLAAGRSYDFGFLRNLVQGIGLGEGIAPVASLNATSIPGDLLVTTSGSGLGVSIATGRAFVQGDSSIASQLTNAQGQYFCYVNPAQSVTLSTADATNPRIDQIVLRVYDSDVDASGSIKWAVEKVNGTPTVGATLTNLSGAAALPSTALRLAYVLVPAGFTGPFVNATHILDQRNLARIDLQACTMYRNAALSPANITATKVTVDTTLLDTGRMADTTNNRINIRQAGQFDVFFGVRYNAPGGAGTMEAQLYKNGAEVSRVGATAAASRSQGLHGALRMSLAAGDYLELYTYQGTGGAVALTTGAADNNFLSVRRVV